MANNVQKEKRKKKRELASNLKRKGKFSHIFSNAYRT